MIALSVGKLKVFLTGKQNLSLNKAKKRKQQQQHVFVESLDQFQRLEVHER